MRPPPLCREAGGTGDTQIVSRRPSMPSVSKMRGSHGNARRGVSGSRTPQLRRLTAPHHSNTHCSPLHREQEATNRRGSPFCRRFCSLAWPPPSLVQPLDAPEGRTA
jgi:hypothetical protein